MKTYLLIAAAVVTQPAASLAQTAPAGAGFQQVQTLGSAGDVIVFTAGGRGGRGGLIAGKPYSATAVTHTVQVLADGSQIERTESQVLYRDEQGRTRNEANEGRFVQIVDRVAGVSYSLDTTAKTARTTEMIIAGRGAYAGLTPAPALDAAGREQKLSASGTVTTATTSSTSNMATTTTTAASGTLREQSAVAQERHTPNLATEDLGTQFINGVQAKGVRTTSTIPVGAIGNNRELKTVSERWESKDLGIMIKSVNADPRFGTTTYELTNIVQGAPDPSLFRVPADYTVLQAPKRD
jgi:hypothetical protein